MPVLNARSLTKVYGDFTAVAGLDLAVERGECFGLLGPNGAGKTTTLRLLLGLTEPNDGDIDMLGHAIPAHARLARQKIGVVPQMDNLDPDFTVRENLLVYARYFGIKKDAALERVPELLQFAELEHRADARIQTLSGGMKRRLTLARALINDPDILFLDEPTTGLDPQARHMMWQRLRRLLAQGKTILLTTHFMEEAERLCDRLAIMDHGKIITLGTPRELISTHIEPHVCEIYGDDLESWRDAHGHLCQRLETSGETLFCYSQDPDCLLPAQHAHPQLRYLNRAANLEDVFLKLTGRDLRD